MKKKILTSLTLFCFTFSTVCSTEKRAQALNVTSVISFVTGTSEENSVFSKAANYVKKKLSALTGIFEAPNSDLKGADIDSNSEGPEIITGTCWDVPCSGGSCEKTCVWSLNKTSGTIILSDPRFGMIASIEWDNPDDKNLVKIGIIDEGIGISYVNHPFKDLQNLEQIIIPDSTSGNVFTIVENCSKIEELTIPKDIERLYSAADLCDGLKVINIGTSTFSADRAVFYKCPNVISINVSDDNTAYKSVNGALLNKNGTILNSYPFGRSSRIVIPYGVTQTMSRTLAAVPSSSIVIPETVENMTEPFDEDCSNLKEINFLGENAPEKVKRNYNVCDLSKDVPHFKAGTAVINVPQSYNCTEFWGYPVNKVFDDYGYLADTTTYWTTKNNGTHLSIGGEGELTSDLLSDENQGWFEHNTTLEEIDIEEGITAVDMNMFADCDKLKKITFPSTLKKLVIADGTTTVDTSLFANCSNLAEVVLPESAKSLIFAPGTTWADMTLFTNFENISEITFPSSVETLVWRGTEDNLAVNFLGEDYPRSSNYLFFGRNMTTNVCSDYKDDSLLGIFVTRPFNCDTCNGMRRVSGPHNIFEITGTGAIDSKCPWKDFKNSTKKLVLGDGITSIAPGTFYGYDFEELELPKTLEKLGRGAFGACKYLTKVVIPSNVTDIAKEAFKGCASLQQVTFDEGTTSVGKKMFAGCSSLKQVNLPESMQNIGAKAFSGCKALKKIELGKNIDSVGQGAFLDCYNLNEIKVDSQNQDYCDIDGALFSKDGTALVQYPLGRSGEYVLPDDTKEVAPAAFCGAETLESVEFNGNIETIGADAFLNCRGLKSVTLNGAVSSIDNNAFAFCGELEEVNYLGDEEPNFGENVFEGCNNLKTVTVGENYKSETFCGIKVQ